MQIRERGAYQQRVCPEARMQITCTSGLPVFKVRAGRTVHAIPYPSRYTGCKIQIVINNVITPGGGIFMNKNIHRACIHDIILHYITVTMLRKPYLSFYFAKGAGNAVILKQGIIDHITVLSAPGGIV